MHLRALGNSGRVCFLQQNIYISPGYVPRTRETYLATLPLSLKFVYGNFKHVGFILYFRTEIHEVITKTVGQDSFFQDLT